VQTFYRFHFALFVSFDIALPSYEVSFELMKSALANFPSIGDPGSWGDPQELSSTSQGASTALNTVSGTVRCVVVQWLGV
jgi:hypothetical protein